MVLLMKRGCYDRMLAKEKAGCLYYRVGYMK